MSTSACIRPGVRRIMYIWAVYMQVWCSICQHHSTFGQQYDSLVNVLSLLTEIWFWLADLLFYSNFKPLPSPFLLFACLFCFAIFFFLRKRCGRFCIQTYAWLRPCCPSRFNPGWPNPSQSGPTTYTILQWPPPCSCSRKLVNSQRTEILEVSHPGIWSHDVNIWGNVLRIYLHFLWKIRFFNSMPRTYWGFWDFYLSRFASSIYFFQFFHFGHPVAFNWICWLYQMLYSKDSLTSNP